MGIPCRHLLAVKHQQVDPELDVHQRWSLSYLADAYSTTDSSSQRAFGDGFSGPTLLGVPDVEIEQPDDSMDDFDVTVTPSSQFTSFPATEILQELSSTDSSTTSSAKENYNVAKGMLDPIFQRLLSLASVLSGKAFERSVKEASSNLELIIEKFLEHYGEEQLEGTVVDGLAVSHRRTSAARGVWAIDPKAVKDDMMDNEPKSKKHKQKK